MNSSTSIPALPAGLSLSAASDDDIDAICGALRAYNRKTVGDFDVHPLALQLHDAHARRVAGLAGSVYLGWLAIDVLWVDEACRGQGLGSLLLREAEQRAMDLGAHGAFLDTFAWQAEGFHARHGYREFGRLDDFPRGQPRLFMRKALQR